MKRFLPVVFFILLLFLLFSPLRTKVYAATPNPLPTITLEGTWDEDRDVTFVGKMVARSNDFINWLLVEDGYKWIPTNIENNPLVSFWLSLRNIVYAFLVLFVLVTAFLMIVNRGKDITITKFIPKFILIILFITFSFSLINFLYQITDIIQGFFIKGISSNDLLSVGFNYQQFTGSRRVDVASEESVFMSLLLAKATALTYYIMGGILIVRKIILWFFIIISPILPLLFFFYPIRNTAKIWIGEFFRWLLYAPVFAILLKGLVEVWKAGFLTKFDFFKPDPGHTYQTAVNILLGAPGQVLDYQNSLNNPNTFAQYILALLMLWVVMLLPFILLHIFLDYLFTLPISNYPIVKQFLGNGLPFVGRPVPVGPTPSPVSPPSAPVSTGLARALPFARQAVRAFDYARPARIADVRSIEATRDILRLANLTIPTMRDIAKYEAGFLSRDITKRAEVTKMHESLQRIANPNLTTTPVERDRFATAKTQLTQEKQKGNPVASSILSAASSTRAAEGLPGIPTPSPSTFPVVNRVQTVSFDDYESVKKLWQENYQTMEVPKAVGEEEKTREEWIKSDTDKIAQTINLLSSGNPLQVKQGMDNVSQILPFLLVGGFSQTEVIAYLKAKLEAGKSTLSQLQQKQEEEETTIETTKKEEEKPKEMAAQAKVEPDKEELKDGLEENKETSDNSNTRNL